VPANAGFFMSYFFLLIFALFPSIIWLLFYLRKDVHPESNLMVIKIFLYGMLVTLPAIFLGIGIFQTLKELNLSPFLFTIGSTFLGVALVEELLKYLVVKEKVLTNPELDEPIDIVLYMIIAALGFAAVENVLILLPLGPNFLLGETIFLSAIRFVGATFLHALSSGLVGYFLVLSFFETKSRVKLVFIGLALATFLHGLYNFSIITIEGGAKLIIPIIILISLAIFVSLGFKKLQKMKSVCKIN
jgi:RsiW-degrading membrane proteinase PrsW (M82 family)